MQSVGSPLEWSVFGVVVIVMLALDLGVFHRKAHVIGVREAAMWSAVWIGLALLFAVFVFWRFGSTMAGEFVTAWVIEKALSVDNIFVFLVIFSYFAVPSNLQHRILFWGILGALVTRGVFIVVGVTLLKMFHWVMYVFGAFLVFTAAKLLLQKDEEIHPERNPVLRIFRRFVPTIPEYRGKSFLVKQDGRTYATPLLLVLVVVEATDVVFAVDSIPAVFAISTDPFIVYTSNIFAILGLRALTFLVASIVKKLHHLKAGLALILAFVGVKMLIADWYKIPTGVSLGVIGLLLVGAGVASVLFPPKQGGAPVVPPIEPPPAA